MAKSLSVQGSNGASQAAYLAFVQRYDDADREVREAVASRKDLRAAIKAAGIPLASFDRARKDADVSGEMREHHDLWYRKLMAWQRKPVGFQGGLDLGAPATDREWDVHELHAVDNQGFDSGKGGRKRDSNPWTPGTEAFQRWDNAWIRGQAEIASTLGDKPAARKRTAANGAAANGAENGRRGRPLGSRNKPKKGEIAPVPTHEAGEGTEPAGETGGAPAGDE